MYASTQLRSGIASITAPGREMIEVACGRGDGHVPDLAGDNGDVDAAATAAELLLDTCQAIGPKSSTWMRRQPKAMMATNGSAPRFALAGGLFRLPRPPLTEGPF